MQTIGELLALSEFRRQFGGDAKEESGGSG